MNKSLKKTTLITLLAIFLWGGVGFSFEKTDINQVINIKNASAARLTNAQMQAQCQSQFPDLSSGDYKNCFANLWSSQNELGWLDRLVLRIDRGVQATKDFGQNLAIKAFAAILYVILLFANWLAALAGNLFDVSVNYSILKISTYTEILESISIIWAVLRNLINITFIFVLLWISIKTILSLSGTNTKHVLASVIVAALLINFSLFATRVIIDVGNLISVSLYSRVLQEVPADSTGKQYISSAIVNNVGLSKLYEATNNDSENVQTGTGIIYMIVKIILAFITAWAFFFAAFLFIIRIIAFFILMVFSPIGFVGEVIPYLKPYAKQWWDTLFNQILVAPVFLLFMFILISVSKTGSFVVDTANASQLPVTLYFNFAVIMALLIAAVKVTKKLSGEFGGVLTSFGAGVVGAGIGLATGVGASALRRTVGSRALDATNNEELKKRALEKGISGMSARMQLAAAQKLSKSSFDVRSTKVGDLMKKTGIDVNKGMKIQKGGFAQTTKDAEKEAEEKAKFYTEGIKADLPTERARIADGLREKTEEYDRMTMMPLPTDAEKLAEHKAKMEKINKEHAELTRQSKLNDDDLKKDYIKREKEERLEKLAKREERKNQVFGTRLQVGGNTAKARAAKIRKAIKSKTEEETFIEAAQKLAKKNEEAEAKKTKGNETTATTPNTAPSTSTPPPPTNPAP